MAPSWGVSLVVLIIRTYSLEAELNAENESSTARTTSAFEVDVVTARNDVISTMPQPYDASCDWTKSSNQHVIISLQVFLIISTFFVIIGLMGNMVSLIVFSSSEMRKISSSVYLLLLSVSDSVYLLCIFCTKTLNILRCWHISSLAHDLRNYSFISCVLFQYFLDLTSDYSSCLILLFTLERFAAVYWPVRFKEMCTVTRARIAAGTTFAVVALSIGPPHHFLLRLYSDYNLCALSDLNGMIVYNLYILEMIVFRVLPALIIAILNGFIVAKVAKISRLKKKRKNSETVGIELKTCISTPMTNKEDNKKQKREAATTTTPIGIGGLFVNKGSKEQAGKSANIIKESEDAPVEKSLVNQPCEAVVKVTQNHQQLIHRRQKQQIKRAEDKNLQLTVILILVSTTYVVAYLPTLIHFIIDLLSYGKFLSVNNEARMIARHYTDLLYVSAFATNFFLFTMSGRVFRQQMWKIFCRSSVTSGSNCSECLRTKRRTTNGCENK